MKQFTISPNESGQRFDKYLKIIEQCIRQFCIQDAAQKNITLNDRKADGTEKLNAGDLVKLFCPMKLLKNFPVKMRQIPAT